MERQREEGIRLKILHINSYYTTGAFYKHLYDGQAQMGDEPRVYVPASRSLDARGRDFGDYTDVAKILPGWDRLFFHLRYGRVQKDALSRYGGSSFDALHAHSLFSNGYVAAALAQKLDVPFITAVRNTDAMVFFRRMPHLRGLGRSLLRRARSVVFLSPAYRDGALTPYLPKDELDAVLRKSHVIPNGIDPFWLANPGAPRKKPNGAVRLLLVGKVQALKNIPAAAQAVVNLREGGVDAHLTVVGAAEDKALAQSVSALPGVTLLPPRPMKELLPLYRESDIFVMPSFRETFGLVYAEAISQGLPVLYTRGQGFDGQFPDGRVGHPVDPRDPGDIAKKALSILDNYEEISQNCVLGATRFDWKDIIRAYRALYEQAKQ